MTRWEGPMGYSTKLNARIMRIKVRSMPCPYCGAAPGAKCTGVRGQKRTANHQERWDLYRERRDATLQ